MGIWDGFKWRFFFASRVESVKSRAECLIIGLDWGA